MFLFKPQGYCNHPDRSEQGSGKKSIKWMEADAKDNINPAEAVYLPDSTMPVNNKIRIHLIRNNFWNGLPQGIQEKLQQKLSRSV